MKSYKYFAMKRYYFLFLVFVVFFACTNDTTSESVVEIDDHDSTIMDELNDIPEFVENSNSTSADEVEEATVEIVKKYGEQWDFCTCVVKQDSINAAMLRDDISDDEFDRLMERSDYVDNKCKTLLIQPNNTPEDRAKHEKKVKNCLRSGKK
jgi:hypothetical protein